MQRVREGSNRYVGRTTDAIKLSERVLTDAERILGPEHHDTLRVAVILAFSYWDAGRTTEAIELGERTLADSNRIPAPSTPTR